MVHLQQLDAIPRLAGPNWEIYGHWLREWDADSSLIRTDVFYLVEP